MEIFQPKIKFIKSFIGKSAKISFYFYQRKSLIQVTWQVKSLIPSHQEVNNQRIFFFCSKRELADSHVQTRRPFSYLSLFLMIRARQRDAVQMISRCLVWCACRAHSYTGRMQLLGSTRVCIAKAVPPIERSVYIPCSWWS